MKQRKLFAILTLVAFMMTLLPMAAFAAEAGPADRFASYLTVDKTKVDAADGKHAEFNVYVRDKDYNPVSEAVYIATERGATDTIVFKEDTVFTKTTDKDEVVYAVTPVKGRVTFDLSSNVAGETTVAVGLNSKVYQYLIDSDTTAAGAELIGTRTVTFEATKAGDVQLAEAEGRKGVKIEKFVEVGTGTDKAIVKGDRQYGDKETPLRGNTAIAANGTDYYELTFRVANANNVPIAGEKVEFSASRNNVRFNKDEVETDEIGEATVRVYSDRAGDFEVEAAVGNDTAKVWLRFGAAEIAEIILARETAELVATDVKAADSFRLEFRDTNGTKLNPKDLFEEEELEFEWIKEPSDADMDDKYWDKYVTGEETDKEMVAFTSDNLMRIYLPSLDEEGEYVLRVNIPNGRYVDVEFEAREQGDIVELTLSYDSKSVQLGATSTSPTVKRIDSDGVAVSATNNLRWSINDYRVLADRSEFNNNGVLVITDDDDYVGSYTVTVVDTKENLTATAKIEVGAEVIGLEVEAGKLVVNEDNTITLRTIDAQGNVIALGKGIKNFKFDYYVTGQPQGANAYAEATNSEGKMESDLTNKGEANVDVFGREKGTVNMVFVVEYDKDAGFERDKNGNIVEDEKGNNIVVTETYRFAQPASLTFGEAAADKPGAGNVTLFIGQQVAVVDGAASVLDVAPFIKDGRTFVPVRFVAEALGCDVKWDEATQTVTATRGDDVIVLTIGSNVMTVNGEATVTDVAPFIAEGNRTVLPFRAVAEAFGAEVTWDAATQSVVFVK